MPANLREAHRDQLWLMPPSLSDWLPEDHLAWFVLDVWPSWSLPSATPTTATTDAVGLPTTRP